MCLYTSQNEVFLISSLCYKNFRSKTGTGEKIKYYRLPKNSKIQREYHKICVATSVPDTGQIDIEKIQKINFLLVFLIP